MHFLHNIRHILRGLVLDVLLGGYVSRNSGFVLELDLFVFYECACHNSVDFFEIL